MYPNNNKKTTGINEFTETTNNDRRPILSLVELSEQHFDKATQLLNQMKKVNDNFSLSHIAEQVSYPLIFV